jgi:hypothetical protein
MWRGTMCRMDGFLTALLKNIGAFLTSLFVFGVTIWALAYVFKYIGTAPVVDSSNKVVQDDFANAKSILLVVLPLATTGVGYWLGNQGTASAKADAKNANAKKDALLAASPPEHDLLSRAKAIDPDAFK